MIFLPFFLLHWATRSASTPSVPNCLPYLLLYSLQDALLTVYIFSYVLVKIIKVIYLETRCHEKSNKIPHDNIILCLSMGICGQSCKSLTPKKQMGQTIRDGGSIYIFLVWRYWDY